MATIRVQPGQLSSAIDAAQANDTLILERGIHNLGTGFKTINKPLIIQGVDWFENMFVTGTYGHDMSAISVQVRGRFSLGTSADGSVFRGFGMDGGVSTQASGTWLNSADGVIFEDLACQNRTNGFPGRIFFTWGAPTRILMPTARRMRMRLIGDPARDRHDHVFYIKNADGAVVEDSLIYDCPDGWAFHFYPNSDNARIRRVLVDRCDGGATFSGANDSSTGLTGCLQSSGNIIEDSILTNAQDSRSGLVESWWGCTPIGTGNVVRTTNLWQGPGAAGQRVLSGNGGFTVDSSVKNVDPKYKNPAIGDYTLAEDSPVKGWGPVGVQPGTVTPPPPVDTTPPLVDLVSPTEGSRIIDTVVFEASASDNVDVSRVEFYINTQLVYTDSSSPYLSSAISLAGVPNGANTVKVAAYDTAGNKTEKVVNVLVGPENPPPPDDPCQPVKDQLAQTQAQLANAQLALAAANAQLSATESRANTLASAVKTKAQEIQALAQVELDN